jgi:hypothetical protein
MTENGSANTDSDRAERIARVFANIAERRLKG